MTSWKVIEKKTVPHERGDGYYMVLVVERNGQKREAVVSGATWYETPVGGSVNLSRVP